MSTLIAPVGERTHRGRRALRTEKRRLKRQDALSGRLAELHAISALLGRAADVVSAGWVQGAWFTVATPTGGDRAVKAYDLGLATERPVTGACLVGAVVQAGGGPANVRSQVVQRSLDLLSHALHEEPDRPVRWCPGPRMRMMAVLGLTRWNDEAGRTCDEVVELLGTAQRAAQVQQELCRAERAQLESAGELVALR